MCKLIKILDSDAAQDRIRTAILKSTDAERFLLLAKIAINNSPRLQECDGASTLSCLVKAAQLGLYIGFCDAYLVPYKTTCTLQIGYQGMLKLLYRSGMTSMKANVVYENDQFEYVDGTESKIVHKRAFGDRKNFVCAYAIAQTGEFTQIEIMDKREIDFIRSRSKAAQDMPWRDFYDEMAKKTVIKRLFKRLPQENFDPSVIEAIRSDDPLVEKNNAPERSHIPMDVPTRSAAIVGMIA
ncbi:MAG: recombinase RecT [Holosporaceae bacterium]|jgi:recombination protein RecT|nr:recombinase RecT [Holosporaceae bacterium]